MRIKMFKMFSITGQPRIRYTGGFPLNNRSNELRIRMAFLPRLELFQKYFIFTWIIILIIYDDSSAACLRIMEFFFGTE